MCRNGGIRAVRPAHPNYPKCKWLVAEGYALDVKQKLTVQVLGNYHTLACVAVIQLDVRPFTPCSWYVEVNDLPAGARRTVMNEVRKAKGLHPWEVMEKDLNCRKQELAAETAVPDRTMDLLQTA